MMRLEFKELTKKAFGVTKKQQRCEINDETRVAIINTIFNENLWLQKLNKSSRLGLTRSWLLILLEFLRPNRGHLFNFCNIKFSLKTINIAEYMHFQGLLHRDIKPKNILMGLGHNAIKVSNESYLFCIMA
ncbi:casein kinase I-like protein [Medicago truncatula]|uniref:Casein kinase I-like protein n=1 Tax=Medicago truncatula TaxID=3880 RepID=G7K6F9_MEDTR|nr:casein kinase I-like protein [Medicago truncatula]